MTADDDVLAIVKSAEVDESIYAIDLSLLHDTFFSTINWFLASHTSIPLSLRIHGRGGSDKV
jgi:hypothetical protein